jgi:hypothetical protein
MISRGKWSFPWGGTLLLTPAAKVPARKSSAPTAALTSRSFVSDRVEAHHQSARGGLPNGNPIAVSYSFSDETT